MKILHGRHFAATLLLVVLPLLAQGQVLRAASSKYTIQDLGTLGGTYSEAFGINASGQIVGDTATASGSGHAFLYSGGTMFDLNLPGTSATARAINASGQIAGYYYDGSYQGYVDTNGQITDVGNLGSLYSATYALNASGQACGSSMTSSGDEHAFFWSAE
jgi:probable HAF family extracellular repeat protein